MGTPNTLFLPESDFLDPVLLGLRESRSHGHVGAVCNGGYFFVIIVPYRPHAEVEGCELRSSSLMNLSIGGRRRLEGSFTLTSRIKV